MVGDAGRGTRALGREVRYDVYDDEGHGFTRWPTSSRP